MAINTQKVTVRFDKTDVEQFEQIAKKRGISRHAVIKGLAIAQLKGGDFPVSSHVKTPGTG